MSIFWALTITLPLLEEPVIVHHRSLEDCLIVGFMFEIELKAKWECTPRQLLEV